MKILFICGCLEPGKDGVGDYTRRLTKELIKYDHEISILSLNDHFLQKNAYIEQIQDFVPVVRVRFGNEEKRILTRIKKKIEELDPDWLSLQFVPFAFQKKGLPWHLRSKLAKIGTGRKWHMMIHELWLGEEKTIPLRHKLLGVLQKGIIKDLIFSLKVEKVFTSNFFYRDCLKKIGVDAEIVPIFSNIPKGNKNGRYLYNKLSPQILENRKRYIIASFFGTIFFSDDLSLRISRLNELVKKENMKLAITHLGRDQGVTAHLQHWHDLFGIDIHSLGECDAQKIADYFQQIDFGLSSYPKILLEKSGSIAAMNENGLSVILLRESFKKDEREFSWIKEIEEINRLGDFLNLNNSNRPYSQLESAGAKYSKLSVKKHNECLHVK